MNIESLLYKISLFEELVIDSGFKRDILDFKQAIGQAQNQNMVFMKDLSKKVKLNLRDFQNYSLHSELMDVLRESIPFTALNTLDELDNLDEDSAINAQQYYEKFNAILNRIQKSINSNQEEINQIKAVFERYVSSTEHYESDEEQGVMSLIFKDLKTTGSLKEFSKVLHRWNRTLTMYHTLIKARSPKEISLVEIQNGSIDVIFNVDIDVAIDLAELFKTGLKVYGAYLIYKSEKVKEIIESYMGNKELIKSEVTREKLMLGNIMESMKDKAIQQHRKSLKTEASPVKEAAEKKAEEVAKVIADHIVKGNEIKFLNPPKPESEEEEETEDELKTETAKVRERWKKLNEEEKQYLLDKYSYKDDQNKKSNN